jgi:undecaprenyl-diphosphatase
VLGLIVKLGFELPDRSRRSHGRWSSAALDAAGRALRRAQPDRATITWTVAILVGWHRWWPACSPAPRARPRRSSSRCWQHHAARGSHRVRVPRRHPHHVRRQRLRAAARVGNGEAVHEDWTALAVAFVASAVTAFVAVKWLLNYIKGHRFTVFAIYRFILGIALLLLVPAGS